MSLFSILPKRSGRSQNGQVSVRHQGGRHKRYFRKIDFKRDKKDVLGEVVGIEYDPSRTSRIALLHYQDGEKRYILAPDGLVLGDKILRGETAEVKVGNALSLGKIPIGTQIHNLEIRNGQGGQITRSAGSAAYVLAHEEDYTQIKLPSGEVRRIGSNCLATIGQVGLIDWRLKKFKKAGTKRHLGVRPTVRGVAQNPHSHPHGGGEGRSGIGMSKPKTYAGRPAVGKTRKKTNYSNKFIVKRRK